MGTTENKVSGELPREPQELTTNPASVGVVGSYQMPTLNHLVSRIR